AGAIQTVSNSAQLKKPALDASIAKWRVILELEARNLLKPMAPTQTSSSSAKVDSSLYGLIGRFFSRKA
ncbi:MAG: hypothetical protein AB8B79_01590, partial [Granulosicoccus sp.]